MDRFLILGIVYVFCGEVALAAAPAQCPNLSNPAQWNLENHFIKYQDQQWYVSDFWHGERTKSGSSLPVPVEYSELTKAKSIILDESLPSGDCLYKVITNDQLPAKLVIKRMIGH